MAIVGEYLQDRRRELRELREGHGLWNARYNLPVVKLRVGLLTVVLLLAVASHWWPRASEVNQVVGYGAYVAMSCLSGQWEPIAILYALMFAMYFGYVIRHGRRNPARARLGSPSSQLQLGIIYVFRQALNVEALTPLLIFFLTLDASLGVRVFFAVAVLLFGAFLVEGVDGRRAFYDGRIFTTLDWGLRWSVLPGSYVLPLAGLGLLAMRGQLDAVWPLLAVVTAAVTLRGILVAYFRRDAARGRIHGGAPGEAEPAGGLPSSSTYTARAIAFMVGVAMLGPIPTWLAWPIYQSAIAGDRDKQHRLHGPDAHDSAPERTADAAARGSNVGAAPRLGALFIVSDNQFHELRGKRTGGQLQIVDEMVKVASRPVELDLLSGASLVQFARIYGQLVAEQRGETPLKWAHLGDWGDMGCRSELDRVAGYVKLFAKHGAVAALAPGNHDSTFVGNFTWHPAWDEACATQDKLTSIVDKLDTNQRLAALSGAAAKPHGLGEKSWLASAASIATGPTRVTAAFLDTSDYTGFTIGFAGVQGSVSRAQADDVVAKVNAVSSDGPVVLLMHHTYDELSKWGQYNVDRIVSKLGTRVIGLVAAHTHMVGQRRRKFGARCLPELVVGSTTDPPQEAALLEIFPDAGASYSLSLSTIPAVSRSPESDGDLKHFHAPGDASSAYVTGDDCRDAFAALRKRSDACRELFTPAPIMRQCLLTPEENREEAARLSRGESPLALDAGERTPGTPEQLKCEQEWRARRLLACIEPGAAPPDGEVLAPSNAKLFELVDARLADEGERVNVVCLGWAASILQGHKSEHWDFQDALAYAREGSVAAPAEHLTGRPEECTAP